MKNNALKAGLITGLITILLFFITYQISPKGMLSPFLYWGSLLISFFGMLGAALLEKRRGNGVLPFRKGLTITFLTFLLANFLFFIFYYWMFTSYAPELPALQKEISAEFYEHSYSGAELRKKLRLLEESDFGVTLQTIFSGYAYGAIGGFFLSLLLALLVREEA